MVSAVRVFGVGGAQPQEFFGKAKDIERRQWVEEAEKVSLSCLCRRPADPGTPTPPHTPPPQEVESMESSAAVPTVAMYERTA